MPLVRQAIIDLSLAAFIFTAAGCLVSSSNRVTESGTPVGQSTLRQVEIGKTSESWLLAALGPPTTRCKVQDQPGIEVLSYNHRVVRKSNGHVLFLFAGSNEKIEGTRTFFEITDGVVSKYWTES